MVTSKFLYNSMNFISISRDSTYLWLKDNNEDNSVSFSPTLITNKLLTDVYNPIKSNSAYLLGSDTSLESYSITESRQEFQVNTSHKCCRSTGFARKLSNNSTLLYGYSNYKNHSQCFDVFDIV